MSAADSPTSRFQLIRRLAAGGMGEVLLARFEGDARMSVSEGLVVIKRAISGSGQHAEQNQMLREEGRVGLRLRHANVVETFSLESYGDEPILVIEYLAGKSMAQVLGSAKKKRQPVPIGIALKILRDAACGLHFAHTLQIGGQKLGLIHRDVSPANIFVTFDGRAKVIDFGVAKAKDSEIKTSTGILKGKVGYMSPEQVSGLELDSRSDVWALGVFFWELLLAERLFVSTSPADTLGKILNMDLPRPSSRRSDVPTAIDRLCAGMLERNRDFRFPSCAELVNEIDLIAQSANETQLQSFALERFPEDGQQGLEEARDAAKTIGREAPPSGLVDGSYGDWDEKTIDQPVMSVVYQRARLLGTFESAQHEPVASDEANTVPVPHLIFSSEAELGPPTTPEEKRLDWAESSNTNSNAENARAPAPPRGPDAAREIQAPTSLEHAVEQPGSQRTMRSHPTVPPAPAAHPRAPIRLLDIGLLSFGLFAVVTGLSLSLLAGQLMDERKLEFFSYLSNDGTDVVVARREDAPPSVLSTPFALSDREFRTEANQAKTTLVPAARLRGLLEKSGVLQRAQLQLFQGRLFSAMLPFLISILGAFSLALGVPAVLRLATTMRRALQLGGALVVAGTFAWGLQFGLMTWPGLQRLDTNAEPPRMDFKNEKL